MSELGELKVRISADTSELKTALKNTDAEVKKAGESLETNLSAGLRNVAIATAAAVAGIALFVNRTMDMVGATTDLAYRLNTSVSSLQAFQRAAQLTGIEDATGLLTIFNRQLSEAATSAEGPAAEALKRLGLSAAQLLQLPIDERIALLGERMVALIPAGQHAAIATAFFGRSAQQALEILRDSSSIQSAREELVRLGVALSNVDAEKINEADDSLTSFGLAAQGAGTQLTLALAPVLYKISQDFSNAAQESGGFKTVMETVAIAGYALYAVLSDIAHGLGMIVVSGAAAAQTLHSFLTGADNTASIDKLKYAMEQMWESSGKSKTVVEDFKAMQAELDKVAEEALAKKRVGTDTGAGTVGLTEAERKALDDKIEALRQATMTEIELEQYKFMRNSELLLEALEAKRITMEEYNGIFERMELQLATNQTEIARKAAMERIALADRETREVNQMRTQAVNLAVGLLTTLGQKNKAAALAAILLNRGLMIATAIQNTAAAATRALVTDPTGATSAYVNALGYAQVGIIAATGLLEAGGALGNDTSAIGSGGNTVGTNTGNVISNANALTNNTGAVPNQAVVQITLVGDNYGKEQVRNLISAINDAVADGSTLRLT